MSSFINKSTKRVAPKLSGLRRRPPTGSPAQHTSDTSLQPSTEAHQSPTPDLSESIAQALPVQQQIAPPTPPPTQSLHLASPECPPSKKRKTTPVVTEDTEESVGSVIQEEAHSQLVEPSGPPSEPVQLFHQPEPARGPDNGQPEILEKEHGVQTPGFIATSGTQTTDNSGYNFTSHAQEQLDRGHDENRRIDARNFAHAVPIPPDPATNPPFGGTIMGTTGDEEESVTTPKVRKVRKDKGTKRKKKPQKVDSGVQGSHDGLRSDHLTSLEETTSSHDIVSSLQTRTVEAISTAKPGEVPVASPTRDSRKRKRKRRRHTDRSSLTPVNSIETATTRNGSSSQQRRQRRRTPSGNERVEIMPSITTMHDLCKDTRTGQTSSKEKRLQARDRAETERQQHAARVRLQSLESVLQSARNQRDGITLDVRNQDNFEDSGRGISQGGETNNRVNTHQGPTLRVVDGVIQVDETSLQVDRHAVQEDDNDPANAPIEEDELSQRITAQSWLYANRRDPEDRLPRAHRCDPWDQDQTRLFYEALRMFGTDFGIISAMFPGRNRRQIKAKFIREERENPELVDEALGADGRVPMNLEQYAQASGRDVVEGDEAGDDGNEGMGFVDPAKLREELAKEEEEARKQIEEVKKEAEEERRQREAAKLHRGDGMNGGEDVDKENQDEREKKKKRKGKSEGKLAKKKKLPPVIAGGEEVVVDSIE